MIGSGDKDHIQNYEKKTNLKTFLKYLNVFFLWKVLVGGNLVHFKKIFFYLQRADYWEIHSFSLKISKMRKSTRSSSKGRRVEAFGIQTRLHLDIMRVERRGATQQGRGRLGQPRGLLVFLFEGCLIGSFPPSFLPSLPPSLLLSLLSLPLSPYGTRG